MISRGYEDMEGCNHKKPLRDADVADIGMNLRRFAALPVQNLLISKEESRSQGDRLLFGSGGTLRAHSATVSSSPASLRDPDICPTNSAIRESARPVE